jgi:hypothetical protein
MCDRTSNGSTSVAAGADAKRRADASDPFRFPASLPLFVDIGGFMRQRLAMTGLFCGLIMGLAPMMSAHAADPATEQRIKALETRMAELERRLGVYESAPPAAATPATPAVSASPGASPIVIAPPPPPPKPISASDWSGLHRGMGERAITTLLGRPQSKQITSVSETWFYDGDRQVRFDRDGRVESWSQP